MLGYLMCRQSFHRCNLQIQHLNRRMQYLLEGFEWIIDYLKAEKLEYWFSHRAKVQTLGLK